MAKIFTRRDWILSTSMASLSYPIIQSLYLGNSEERGRAQSPQIKLSSNENPYGPSEKAKKAVLESLSKGNRYPNKLREILKQQLAEKEHLTTDHVLISAGSTEILNVLGTWLHEKKGDFVTTENTFPILMLCAENGGISWSRVALDSTFKVDLASLNKSITKNTAAVYICNPNNPTGTSCSPSSLEDFCKQLDPNVVAIIDEAYIEYTSGDLRNSMAKLIHDHPNIIIVRTFSKIYGLAGMRIGYALADPSLINQLKKHYLISESCVSSASLSAAIASLDDQNFVTSSFEKNNSTRKYITDHFDDWEVKYAESSSNFIYFPIDQFQLKGGSFRKAMAKNAILCPPFGQDKSNYSRMTIGTQDEMEKVISVMNKLI